MEEDKRRDKKRCKEENSHVIDDEKRNGNGEEMEQAHKQTVAEYHWGMADDYAEYKE